ncbi:MAG: hypothetical protein ABEJ61_00420 [Haloferacaceae archaeon]
MLSGKLPTASLDEPDEPAVPDGPTVDPAPVSGRGRSAPGRRSPSRDEPSADERVERLTAENERLRDAVERERERRKAVVERYERLLDRRDATDRANGRKRAGEDDAADGGIHALVDALRTRVARGLARLG